MKIPLKVNRKITIVDLLCSLITTQYKHRCSIFLMTYTNNNSNKGLLRGYLIDLILTKESIRQTHTACVMLNNHLLGKIFMRSLRTLNTPPIHFTQALYPKRVICSPILDLSKILVVQLDLNSLLQNLRTLVYFMKVKTVKSTRKLKKVTLVKSLAKIHNEASMIQLSSIKRLLLVQTAKIHSCRPQERAPASYRMTYMHQIPR